MKNVILVDDHPLFLAGVEQILISSLKYRVLYKANAIANLMAYIKQCPVDLADIVFVIDISLPDGSGFDLLQLVQTVGVKPKQCVMLSTYNDYEYVEHAFSLGAAGYMVKNDDPNSILDCLAAIARGQRFTSASIQKAPGAIRSSDTDISDTDKGKAQVIEKFKTLSKREITILKLVAMEKTSHDISEQLFISQRTVENHRAKICRKLSVSGTHGLITLAVKFKKAIDLLG